MPFRPDGSYYTPPWEKPYYQANRAYMRPRAPRSGFATGALITLFVFWPVAPLLGVLALNDIRNTGKSGKGSAWLAILIPALMVLIVLVIFFATSVQRIQAGTWS